MNTLNLYNSCPHLTSVFDYITFGFIYPAFLENFFKGNIFINIKCNNGTYRYLSDAENKSTHDESNVSCKLYETVFVDGDGCSCHDRHMLKEMLTKHVYTRWIEYYDSGNKKISGTIHGISEYSLVCVSASNFSATPFLTEYIEIAMLVLAQRASLLAFERRISEISSSQKGEKKLQEDYINFDSQYMLHEVTAQQQGIEIYNLILQRMYIFDQKNDIENQIRNLFELKNFKQDKRMNTILSALALLGIVEIVDVLVNWWPWLPKAIKDFFTFIINLM